MAGGAAADLVLWAVAHLVLGVRLAVRLVPGGPSQQVEPVTIAAVAILAGCAAWALVALLERVSRRSRSIWVAIALAVLAVSLAGPLGAAVTSSAIGALVAMHVVTAAILIPLMAASPPRR